MGVLCGVAWSASFRSYMAAINPSGSTVDALLTFAGVLLPGAIVGASIALATMIRLDRRGRVALRWISASPAIFAIAPMVFPGQLISLVTTGLGGGAVAVALGAIAGGYAIGGSRTWLRVGCGVIAAAVAAFVTASVPGLGGSTLQLTEPRGAWIATLAASLVLVLFVASSVPFSRLRQSFAAHDHSPAVMP